MFECLFIARLSWPLFWARPQDNHFPTDSLLGAESKFAQGLNDLSCLIPMIHLASGDTKAPLRFSCRPVGGCLGVGNKGLDSRSSNSEKKPRLLPGGAPH